MYIVANKDYWGYWGNRMSKTAFSEYFELMAIIGITCLSGENVNFTTQKDNSADGLYTPHLLCKEFRTISM
jgi:hypothetical protein